MDKKIFEPHLLESATLPFIFHFDTIDPDEPNISNWHRNIELLYVTNGSGVVSCGSQKIEITVDDIVIINSNVPHSFSTNGIVQYFCLIPDSDFCKYNDIDTDNINFNTKISDHIAA